MPSGIIIRRTLMLLLLSSLLSAQSVFERGTFTSLPAGKHINHSYYGAWNAFFAVEDGVLVYDHHKKKWLEPITASNGLIQYPALLVWEDQASRNVWIVTPDFVFVYDPQTDWMSKQALPIDSRFSGKYKLGINSNQVLIGSFSDEYDLGYSAIFNKASGVFESWGPDTSLGIDWNSIETIETIPDHLSDIYGSLAIQTIENGSFDGEGKVHLDGFPIQSASPVSAITGPDGAGEVFLSTYGMGVFHQDIHGATFKQLPFGLLSPDVMCLEKDGDQVMVGGRAGLTLLNGFDASYEESHKEPVLDYSFVSAIDTKAGDIFIAARGGIFRKDSLAGSWTRIISLTDLESSRIYSIALGNDGTLMIGTEHNAYLYHESGLILESIFPVIDDWPVFDISYSDGKYYLSTFFGLYIYDEINSQLGARINSHGNMQSAKTEPAIDPIYKSELVGSRLWATTHRGLLQVDLIDQQGKSFLAPHLPFQPRGLSIVEGKAWVGTNNGVYSFEEKAATWRLYTRKDGLISDFVTDLVSDKEYIWLGTNFGLTRIKWRNLH